MISYTKIRAKDKNKTFNKNELTMTKLKDKQIVRYIRSNLFSIDFLENHLEDLDDYKNIDRSILKEKFQEVCKFYYKEDLKNLSEAQLEENFLRPVFKELGHIYEVQTSKKSEDLDEGTKLIDYAFFYTEEDKGTFHQNKNERNAIRYSTCSTICEAKVWGLLEGYDQVKKNDNSDPIWQIKKSYLDNINPKEQKAKVPFGILTDGKFWRIYSYRSEIDKFFEINLEEIIKSKDLDQFKVFWFFFSREAFRGRSFLSSIESGSKKLQSEVSEDLRKQVYLSLELIATGLFRVFNFGKSEWEAFKKYSEVRTYLEENSLSEIDITHPGTERIILDVIYTESLVYLFRILFLLYADHRNLFKHNKVQSIFYQLLDKIESYNLIGNIPENAENISDKNDDYDINGVFEEIDREFNGGLFSIKLHTILNRFDIDNILYANAIDYLTRTFDKKTQKPQRVDFSVLEVRHLGTIYEGLLEYKLTQATEEITIPLLNDKKKTRKLKSGDLYLVNDKGERKASGSYYTPDYIVESIVKFTVGPLIDSIEKESTSLKEKIPKILSLRILDPAMGSGHFLVEVISYMNDRIEALIQDEIEEYASKPGRKTKTQIELEALLKEAENGLYKRIIAKRCIYGVDKNPMAVELAKLSIWIYTLQRNRKLEFFDYNLRCGDSLIGSQERTFSSQLDSNTKERMLFADNEELYKNVVEDFKDDFKKYFELESVEERMKFYESIIKPNQQKLKYLANIELALVFSDKNDEIQSIYNAHKNKLLGIIRMDNSNEYIRKLVKGNDLEKWEVKLFNAAKKVRDNYNPIHWELDFPNVFIEKGGFDAVVGNPPYVRSQQIEQIIKNYLINIYSESASYQPDTFSFFLHMGIMNLNEAGLIGYIIPNGILTNSYYEKLRYYILNKTAIKIIVNLKSNVFEGAAVDTSIFVLKREINLLKREKNILYIGESSFGLEKRVAIPKNKIMQKILLESEKYVFNTNISKDSSTIILKIKKTGTNLEEFLEVKAGMKVRKDFIIGLKTSDSRYKKFLLGSSINPYDLIWKGKWVCYDKTLESKFTNQAFRDEEIFLAEKKILIRQVMGAKRIYATIDEEKYYADQSIYILVQKIFTYDLNYLLGLICSKAMTYYFRQTLSDRKETFPKIKGDQIKILPIAMLELSNTIQKSTYDKIVTSVDLMLSQHKDLQESQKKFTKLLQSDLKIEKLSDKLEEWNNLSFDDFLGELKKKKIELKLDKKAEWMDYFEKEKANANAVQEVISRTDSEIDAMVYKLYGLTEEEIRIVEEGV